MDRLTTLSRRSRSRRAMTLVSSLVLITVLSFGWLGSLHNMVLFTPGNALQAGTLCTMARFSKLVLSRCLAVAWPWWHSQVHWLAPPGTLIPGFALNNWRSRTYWPGAVNV